MRAETMAFILMVFAIGVLNLGLGFALAVSLRLRPPIWVRFLGLFGLRTRSRKIREEAIKGPVHALRQTQQTASPRGAPLPTAAEEAYDTAREAGEFDLDAFCRFVALSVSSLTDFAARLKRSHRGDPQRTAWGFVAELQGICQAHLQKLTLAAERLSEELGDDVNELVLEQTAQLETTLSNLQYMDFDSGVAAAMECLSQESGNTLSAAHRLQRAMEALLGAADRKASEASPQSSDGF